MTLRQIEVFVAVAQAQSFRRAAERLHTSQPALSQHVRELEEELGTRLLDRLGRAVQLTEAELAVRNAELALRDSELALARRAIVAPISGVVGIISVSAGSYVTSQSEIATIDDRSEILVDFWVPERFAGMLSVGDPLEATSIARPGDVFQGKVSAIDNRIDADSRTMRVQASIGNPDDALRAGMSFNALIAIWH